MDGALVLHDIKSQTHDKKQLEVKGALLLSDPIFHDHFSKN